MSRGMMSRGLMSRGCASAMLLVLCLTTFAAQADVRAWLSRDRIALGDSTTLNIETDQIRGDAPDYSPLLQDFELSGHSRSSQLKSINGQTTTQTLYAVALHPRREGVIGIPAIRVGSQQTQPLTLTVAPAAVVPAQAGATVFIQTEIDDLQPYVQQAVGITLRLYYAEPLLSGRLDQPTPDGASLREVGSDLEYTRQLADRRYNVLERHYLLIPERSGRLTLPGAHFQGRGVNSFFDDLMGSRGASLEARSQAHVLEVQPPPATNAPQPWLPLHDLRLRYLVTPQSARAGQAATVVVEAVTDGATAAQIPELQLTVAAGAQVFAEPVQIDESVRNGRPQATVTRRFSVVPATAGTLRIEGPALDWWDVDTDARQTAQLPALELEVKPGQGAFAPSASVTPPPGIATGDDDGNWIDVPGARDDVRPWALATVAFALLWLLTLGWALQRRRSSTYIAAKPASQPASRPRQALKRALETGDLGDVADALCASAVPVAHDLDAVRERLDDPMQRQAIAALQQARWGDGDAAVARRMLREAFARAPQWRNEHAPPEEPLPPLYPR